MLRSYMPAAPARPVTEADLRRTLRAQIARAERALAAYPSGRCPAPPGGPRLLGVAGLEEARDRLAGALAAARRDAQVREAGFAAARRRLEAMRADPSAHRYEVVHQCELGLGSCGAYRVRPRLGLVGLLADWWEVKLSSGCPLWATTTAHPAAAAPTPRWSWRSPRSSSRC